MKLATILLLLSFSAFGQTKSPEYRWHLAPNDGPITEKGNFVMVVESATNDTSTYVFTVTRVKKEWSQRFSAAAYVSTTGICQDVSQGNQFIGCLTRDAAIQYSWSLTVPRNKVKLSYAKAGTTTGTVEIRSGSVTGPVIATLATFPTGSWSTWSTVQANTTVPVTSGTYYMTFKAGLTDGNANVMWIEFE